MTETKKKKLEAMIECFLVLVAFLMSTPGVYGVKVRSEEVLVAGG